MDGRTGNVCDRDTKAYRIYELQYTFYYTTLEHQQVSYIKMKGKTKQIRGNSRTKIKHKYIKNRIRKTQDTKKYKTYAYIY